ncbi:MULTISPECIES: DUF1488 family protein [unclassified Paraburkholderia]|uniref:DUF1488 family protein n=1 Tax=unclassified Paraburkholderia TaxID=2615204 RepID=UPI002811AF83|nr:MULTISPECIES: DUF1488 family protein [unclassified Paraburkholderia]
MQGRSWIWELIMDLIELMPAVTADRREISFRLAGQRSEVACAITREALEAQFWLPAGADQVRMLKAFADGRRRIVAVAERKVRLHPGEVVRLTADDFLIKR